MGINPGPTLKIPNSMEFGRAGPILEKPAHPAGKKATGIGGAVFSTALLILPVIS
jgi:hypothetical protein